MAVTELNNNMTQNQAVRLGKDSRTSFIKKAYVYCLFRGKAAQHKQSRMWFQVEQSQNHPAEITLSLPRTLSNPLQWLTYSIKIKGERTLIPDDRLTEYFLFFLFIS